LLLGNGAAIVVVFLLFFVFVWGGAEGRVCYLFIIRFC